MKLKSLSTIYIIYPQADEKSCKVSKSTRHFWSFTSKTSEADGIGETDFKKKSC